MEPTMTTATKAAIGPAAGRAAARQAVAGWGPVLTVLVARTGLALIVQAALAGFFWLRGEADPWQATLPWWTVYGTAVDAGCLILMAVFLRREGKSLLDLLRGRGGSVGRDLLLALGLVVALFPVAVIGAAMLSGWLIYGVLQPTVGEGLTTARHLPVWAIAYSLTVWWLIWSPTEQMTYNGYVLPRLEALTGRPWLAVALVGFWWAFQHPMYPLMLDWQYVVWRLLVFLPLGVIMPLLFRKLRRLRPLIFMHWVMDLTGVVMTIAF
jgi:membrane protease YdiL (CAAX protease family)